MSTPVDCIRFHFFRALDVVQISIVVLVTLIGALALGLLLHLSLLLLLLGPMKAGESLTYTIQQTNRLGNIHGNEGDNVLHQRVHSLRLLPVDVLRLQELNDRGITSQVGVGDDAIDPVLQIYSIHSQEVHDTSHSKIHKVGGLVAHHLLGRDRLEEDTGITSREDVVELIELTKVSFTRRKTYLKRLRTSYSLLLTETL